MPQLTHRAIVPYSPAPMYALVNDYERYPEFISGCVGARSIERSEKHLTAELTMSKFGVQQSFSTANTMIPHKRIEMRLLKGPFKYLHGFWQFQPLGDDCEISFSLDFEFINPLIAFAFGQVFAELTEKMVKAFENRAKEMYR